MELALALDETDLDTIAHTRDGDLLDGIPLPSPLAWPLAYRWPVHQLRADVQPGTAPEQPTFLLVLRDRSDNVRFKQIDALSYALLQALHDNLQHPMEARQTGRQLLQALAAATNAADTDRFVTDGAALLEQLRECDAILGTAPG